MTVKRWLITGGIALFVIGIGILGWWTYRFYNKAERYETLYLACRESPADTVIVWKERVVFSDDTIRPKPLKSWIRTVRDTIYDTIIIECKTQVNRYADSYRKDGIRIRWEAICNGTLESIQFPNIIVPERLVTVEKKVQVHDTLKIEVDKSHLGIYGKIHVNSLKAFPGLEVGGIYTIRGDGGIMAGGMFDPVTGRAYATIGGFINIK